MIISKLTSAGKNAVSVALALLILSATGYAAQPVPSSPWKYLLTRGGGIALFYQDIPVITKATLATVVKPGWKDTYYAHSNQAVTITTEKDGSQRAVSSNEYFRAEYTYRAISAQTFQLHFRGELLQDVPADMEFNLGQFNGQLFYNRSFSAQIGERADSPAHTVNGVIPTLPLYPSPNDWSKNNPAPNFTSLDVDSRVGQMTIQIESDTPAIFANAINDRFIKEPVFWCGWLTYPLKVHQPVEITMTLQVRPEQVETPTNINFQPIAKSIRNAAVPFQKPFIVVPKPKQMELNEAGHYVLRHPLKWSITAPEQDPRLSGAVTQLLQDTWELTPGKARFYKSTFDDWYGISLGQGKQIPFKANQDKLEWATHEDAYQLTVDKSGIKVISPTARGAFYAVQTLAQLLRSDGNKIYLPYVHIVDWPSLKFRGAMLHFSNIDMPEMENILRIAAHCKYNYVVIPCTNVQWEADPKMAMPGGISPSNLQKIVNLCRSYFIEPIPLVEGPGHVDGWVFTGGQNREIAEDPEVPYAYSVNNPKTYPIVHDLMQRIIDIFHPKYFHIGSDEVTMSGRFPNPENPYNHKDETAMDLIVKNIQIQRNWLAKQGIKTIIWGDMFLNVKEVAQSANAPSIEMAQEGRAALPKDVIVGDWHYNAVEEYPSIELFQKEGLKVIAAPWYQPLNVYYLTHAAIKNKAWGTLQTTWAGALASRPVAFRTLILSADYSWSGRDELPDNLPYDPSTYLVDALTPQFHVPHNGILLDISSAANVSSDDLLGLGKDWSLGDLFQSQQGTKPYRIKGIDFLIPNRRLVVLSLKKSLMAPSSAAQELTLQIGQKAKSIAFLHSTLWNITVSSDALTWSKKLDEQLRTAARCVVEYTDGTHQEIEFIDGVQIASWQGESTAVTADDVLNGNLPSGVPANFYLYTWNNPNPDKTISSIKFIPVSPLTGYALAGVSLID